jgi:hypothetical protein
MAWNVIICELFICFSFFACLRRKPSKQGANRWNQKMNKEDEFSSAHKIETKEKGRICTRPKKSIA